MMEPQVKEPLVVTLSKRQLEAYNRADLDAFCACYHPDVEVMGEDGAVSTRGMEQFRARYADRFGKSRDVKAEIHVRVALGRHVIEREAWSRVDRETGAPASGEILVRYTERDGLIRWVEFLA
jgi:hypothetical protein